MLHLILIFIYCLFFVSYFFVNKEILLKKKEKEAADRPPNQSMKELKNSTPTLELLQNLGRK